MSVLEAIIMGILQGLTEFLPGQQQRPPRNRQLPGSA